MSNNILFIFEGKQPEKQIVYNIQNFFLKSNPIVKSVFGAEIYQLYKEIKADDDLDIFSLLKNLNYIDKESLINYNRTDFAEIYLFFDYDGHSSLADDNKLIELLEYFNEETDKGKLYLSFPMVESLRHISDFESFKELTVNCKTNVNYKNIVHENCLKSLSDYRKFDFEIWREVTMAHLKKMNLIVFNSFSMPEQIVEQIAIFTNQLEKYINPQSKVAVLSAFPVFLHDYYGNQGFKKLLEIY